MLSLNRHHAEAYRLISRYDFRLEGLTGFDMRVRTIGIVGLGHIGSAAASILHGFGCKLLGYDIQPSTQLSNAYNLKYLSLEELCKEADIITLHVPLTDNTR